MVWRAVVMCGACGAVLGALYGSAIAALALSVAIFTQDPEELRRSGAVILVLIPLFGVPYGAKWVRRWGQ